MSVFPQAQNIRSYKRIADGATEPADCFAVVLLPFLSQE